MRGLPPELNEYFSQNPARQRELFELLSGSVDEFIPLVAVWLQNTFDLYAVSIGEVAGDAVDRIKVYGFASRDGGSLQHYDLVHSPCLEVVTQGRECFVADDALREYPQDEAFIRASIRAYVGVPLTAPTGRTIGLVCMFDDKPFEDPELLRELLLWLQVRLQNDLYAQRMTIFIAEAESWTSARSSAEFFRNISRQMTRAMQVSTVIVTEWVGSDNKEIRILAVRHLGESLADFDGQILPHEHTPCKELFKNQQKLVSDNLQQEYPQFQLFKQLNVNSYLGFRVDSREGKPLGHIAVLHSRALDPDMEKSHNLAVFGTPIGAEIERLRDKRRHKELESILLARQKLESLGLMSGAIAHDFNNLLVGILGNASLALDDLNSGASPQKRILQIEQGATRAGEIVAQLLDFAGHSERKDVLSDLSQLVRDAKPLLAFSSRNKESLEFHLAEDLPMVLVDPTLLHQVVVNLVLNAVDATASDHGLVIVQTRMVTLGDSQIDNLLLGSDLAAGEYICLEINDNGCGISEDSLSRIFDPFYTKKENGRGLGLSIVQGIVRGYKAGLEIESMENLGTRVAVYFPASTEKLMVSVSRMSINSINLDKPLAVVDDEESVRAVTVALLESVGYRSIGYAGGKELLAAAESGKEFGAAIIDITMPELDGWATLKRLRDLDANIPVVMMSGFTEYESANELAGRNRVVFLRKPFRSDDMIRALAEAAPEIADLS